MLDVLLEIEQINAVQFTPGTGAPSTYTVNRIDLDYFGEGE